MRLNIRSSWIHFQLGASTQIFKVLAFEANLFTFSRMTLSLKLSLKLVKFKWEEVIILQLSKNVKNFVNATSMESCFGMPIFYISFCYYQINQYGSYWKKQYILKSKVKLCWIWTIRKEVTLGVQLSGRREKASLSFLKTDKKCLDLGKDCPVCAHPCVKFYFEMQFEEYLGEKFIIFFPT